MTEADRIFSHFPSFVQEYIYARGWDSLHPVQLAAAKVIFESEDNLLLSSSTASGKTEAAFFPILSDIAVTAAPPSVSVLYIAPLKSLINDQFERIQELLAMSGIPVFHWHGDVSASHKQKFLREPRGILQITPESLESMLINRKNDIFRIFGGLRYIVLDEIHAMIGSDRGNQVICLLSRLEALIGRSPRRIGLSATLGDLSVASDWLGAGSKRKTAAPAFPRETLRWRLGLSHFYIQDPAREQSQNAPSIPSGEKTQLAPQRALLDAGYEFLYDAVYGKRAIVFSNSREETEYVTATLRQIAKKRDDEDIFLIHHGNLSASLREDAEKTMKNEETVSAVTCATVTLELGIDIGRLERVAQVDAPTTVSGFLQRLGRSGRRETPPEMVMLFREDIPLPNTPLPQLIPWGLLRGIAIVELYRSERFIEPPRKKTMPFSLAFHQTLSILMSSGELSPKHLAERVLSLPPLSMLSNEDYRALLLSMIENDFIELTEEKGLIVGLAGERLTNSFKFYAVFRDSEDFTVRKGSEEIGTITNPPPVGDRFALAGRVWEVTEVNLPRRLVYAKAVDGKMQVSWPGDAGEIHTRILEKMREILLSDEEYPYLLPNARERLSTARHLAKNTGVGKNMLLSLGGQSYVLFPWLGTRSFRAARRFLVRKATELGVSDIHSEGCCYITLKASRENASRLLSRIKELLLSEELSALSLVSDSEAPAYDKYDHLIPAELLRRAFAADRLDAEEMKKRFTKENGGLP